MDHTLGHQRAAKPLSERSGPLTDVKIIDLTELWMHSPECVELSPRLAIIKAKAKAGIELAGVEITRRKVAVIGGSR